MTAMTPACTGSVTTRSAASGTLPAMFRLMTMHALRADLAHRLLDGAAHERARQHQHADARQARHGAHGVGERLLADQRNGVDRDALAADVVAVGLGDGAERHLPDLRAAAHDDDALAVDALERLHDRQAAHDRQRAQVARQRLDRRVERRLEVDAAPVGPGLDDLDQL